MSRIYSVCALSLLRINTAGQDESLLKVVLPLYASYDAEEDLTSFYAVVNVADLFPYIPDMTTFKEGTEYNPSITF